jgi:hypothetical protein
MEPDGEPTTPTPESLRIRLVTPLYLTGGTSLLRPPQTQPSMPPPTVALCSMHGAIVDHCHITRQPGPRHEGTTWAQNRLSCAGTLERYGYGPL